VTELQIAIVAGAAVVLVWVLVANFRDQRDAKAALEKRAAPSIEEPLARPFGERTGAAEMPDEICESIAVLKWAEPALSARVEHELRGIRRVGSKPLLFAWVCEGSQTPQPEPSASRVLELRIGVLLATRSGPLHAMEYTEWQELVMKVATNSGAQVLIPEMATVLSQARSLDQQCAAVDAQLSLVIRADHVLSVESIVGAATAAGLEQRGESRFAMGPVHQQRFSVFPGDSGETLVLLLDVPRTAQPRLAFEEMRQAGLAMASVLSAQLVDESGRLLAPNDFELIAEQVAAREQALQQMGIEPGSPVALRLFL
jgi:hypothetical protein